MIAFAAPEVDLGEVVGVVVVRKPDSKVTLKDLREFGLMNGKMQSKWAPEIAVYTDTIPKGPTAKPARIG